MKPLYLLLSILIIGTGVNADIVLTPGVTPIQPVFDRADLVCDCEVSSLNVTSQQQVRASLQVRDVYKSTGQAPHSIALEYSQESSEVDSHPTVQQGGTYLLFLSQTSSGTYGFADRFIGATLFSSLPQQNTAPGLAKLQSILALVVQQQNRDDEINALRLLRGFDQLGQNTLSNVKESAKSPDGEVALSALNVLLKTETPESVHDLRLFLESYKGPLDQQVIIGISPELGQIRDRKALADIEALTNSKFLAIRFGAMDALRGMKDPDSTLTLIQRLDDANPRVQYLAVITLAETFGKYGEYAPNAALFEKNPQLYKNRWKDWWAAQEH